LGSGKGSHGGDGGRLVASAEEGIPGILHRSGRRSRERRSRNGLAGSEARAPHDHVSQFRNGDPLGRVKLEDALQDGIQFRGNGKNAPEELGVLHVGAESAVLKRGTLPGVASTGQVDQNDSKAPHVIGC